MLVGWLIVWMDGWIDGWLVGYLELVYRNQSKIAPAIEADCKKTKKINKYKNSHIFTNTMYMHISVDLTKPTITSSGRQTDTNYTRQSIRGLVKGMKDGYEQTCL